MGRCRAGFTPPSRPGQIGGGVNPALRRSACHPRESGDDRGMVGSRTHGTRYCECGASWGCHRLTASLGWRRPLGETGRTGAEGVTAPETLRPKDQTGKRHSGEWCGSTRRRDNFLRRQDRGGANPRGTAAVRTNCAGACVIADFPARPLGRSRLCGSRDGCPNP